MNKIGARDWASNVRGINSYATKLVLRELAECFNEHQQIAFPSQAYLEEKLEMPDKTLRNCIAELKKHDLIRIRQKGNQHQRTEYELNFDITHVKVHRQKREVAPAKKGM